MARMTRSSMQKENAELQIALSASVHEQGVVDAEISPVGPPDQQQDGCGYTTNIKGRKIVTLRLTSSLLSSLTSQSTSLGTINNEATSVNTPAGRSSKRKRASAKRSRLSTTHSAFKRVVKIAGSQVGTVLKEEVDEDFVPDDNPKATIESSAGDNTTVQIRRSLRQKPKPTKQAAAAGFSERMTMSLAKPRKVKKEKVEYSNRYAIKFGYSRYGPGVGPSKEEVVKVYDILKEHHAKDGLNLTTDAESTFGLNAGPAHASKECTVHAFVSTVLSQATTNEGALSVQWDMRYQFPFVVNGVKIMGRKPNYHAMRKADLGALIEILRPSGLQHKRARVIKSILSAVYDMNVARGEVAPSGTISTGYCDTEAVLREYFQEKRIECVLPVFSTPTTATNAIGKTEPDSPGTSSGAETDGHSPPDSQSTELTIPEIATEWVPPSTWIKHGDVFEPPEEEAPEFFVSGLLSVKHLQDMNDQDLFDELVSHEGIGVKTASCIMAFNLSRPVFAVDIHVFRMCKFLGWSPDKLKEDRTCELLDFIIPNEIKYALHQAFWHHGQKCGRCRSGATEKSPSWASGCPLDHLIDRSRFVPDQSKAQKERAIERAAQMAEKQAELEAKAAEKERRAAERAIKAEKKAKETKSQKSLIEFGMEVKATVRKRKSSSGSQDAEAGTDGQDSAETVAAAGGRKTKKTKTEQNDGGEGGEEEQRDPAEWGRVRIHDDFDAGRNQNVTKSIWVRIRKIEIKWEEE